QERAQRIERRFRTGDEGIRLLAGIAIDFGFAAGAAPDGIGGEAQDRIAAANRAALHRLQQKRMGPLAAQLEERRYRRLQIGNKRRPGKLRLATLVTRREGRRRRRYIHDQLTLPPVTLWIAS